MKAFSPTGAEIIGTSDFVPANALITSGSFVRTAEGLDFDWVGETVICWSGQTTNQRDRKDLFVDENGEEWTDDQITLADGNTKSPEEEIVF